MAKAAKVSNEWVMKAPVWYSTFNGVEHFYDGSLEVRDGVIRIPANRTEWVSRMLAYGYDFTEEAQRDEYARVSYGA